MSNAEKLVWRGYDDKTGEVKYHALPKGERPSDDMPSLEPGWYIVKWADGFLEYVQIERDGNEMVIKTEHHGAVVRIPLIDARVRMFS